MNGETKPADTEDSQLLAKICAFPCSQYVSHPILSAIGTLLRRALLHENRFGRGRRRTNA